MRFGAYTAPTVIMLLCATAFYVRSLERKKVLAIESAVQEILSVAESKLPIEKIIGEIASIAKNQTKYSRASAYVDGFCIGASESPGKMFFRVMDSGYNEDISRDAVINFNDGRGKFMMEAIKSGKPVLGFGPNSIWFLVVPIGTHAVINLSDSQPKSSITAFESEEIIQKILLPLRSLDHRKLKWVFKALPYKTSFKKRRRTLGRKVCVYFCRHQRL